MASVQLRRRAPKDAYPLTPPSPTVRLAPLNTDALDKMLGSPDDMPGVSRAARSSFSEHRQRRRSASNISPSKSFTRQSSLADDEVESDKTEWPLLISLVPAAASLLFGTDLPRDLVLLVLLFYYMRALTNTPWELYVVARRARHSSFPHPRESADSDAEMDAAAHTRALARTELRLAEITYLTSCFLMPILGALLLHAVSARLAGTTLTWFHTTLFVLAAGIRPWRQLVMLLQERTEHLAEVVESPSTDFPRSTAVNAELEERTEALETMLRELHDDYALLVKQGKMGEERAQSEDRKVERDRLALESRVAKVEVRLEALILEQRQTTRAARERGVENLPAMLTRAWEWLTGAPTAPHAKRRNRRSYASGMSPASLARVPEERELSPIDAEIENDQPRGFFTSLFVYPIRIFLSLILAIVQFIKRVFFRF
ncbi:hypothetical protein BOTBODRAFT_142774 [Botryobasidium botryosum FD-172 SS1]|uniref:Uncharacterized protein n=1 Tax=Botryobasidium botryosum (strain FD-172 SS1) TaxID=930990 RepID=A0A067N7Y2_BOTB1|nr:hypothetical protein BOTBODRAFT_142774 [Botryobasidium botryosum FD-172 SS1]